MALKMPGPVALAPTLVFHLNVRVPADLVGRLRGTRVTLPVAGNDISVFSRRLLTPFMTNFSVAGKLIPGE